MKNEPSAGPRRYLALWFPFLPADRLRRSRSPASSGAPADPAAPAPPPPLIFAERSGNALQIGAVDAAALEMGLIPGLSLADARARIALLQVEPMDRAADARLLRFLARACLRFSPRVALDHDDGLTLDITGCDHLFGGEAAMLKQVRRQMAVWSMRVRAAIAITAEAAHAVARHGPGGIVAAGEEAMAVAPLPVSALRLENDIAGKLIHLGLKRVGDLMARPRRPLAARFGEILIDRLRRVSGEIDVPPRALNAPPRIQADRRFAEPIASVDYAEEVVQALARDIARQLEARGHGGRLFLASFFRADGAVRTVRTAASRGTADAMLIARLFHERLGALADPLDPGFGFDMIRLVVLRSEKLQPAQPQIDGKERSEAETASVVDRLSARLGEEHVLRLAAVDTHDPGRASLLKPALSADAASAWAETPKGEPPVRPLMLFDPPLPVEGVVSEVPDGPPKQFRWRRMWHRLSRVEGPERIEPEWWRDGDPDAARPRDYFRAEDSEGRRFWLYRLGAYSDANEAPRWFIHGLFP